MPSGVSEVILPPGRSSSPPPWALFHRVVLLVVVLKLPGVLSEVTQGLFRGVSPSPAPKL
eukprot:10434004-Karenia_brevis.AAC.1